MKKAPKLVAICALLLTVVLMFLPVAHFADNSAASMDEEIAKFESRLSDAQKKLDRYISGNKSEKEINKQKEQVEKAQANLDEAIAKKEAAADNAEQSGLAYALLPGRHPVTLDAKVKGANRELENAKAALDQLKLDKQAALAAYDETGTLLALLENGPDTRTSRADLVNLSNEAFKQIAKIDELLVEKETATGDASKLDEKINAAATKLKDILVKDQTSFTKLAEEKDAAIAKQPEVIAAAEEALKKATADRDAAKEAEASGKGATLLELDGALINNFKVYPMNGDIDTYHALVYIAAGMLLVGAALLLIAGNKIVSKLYTFSGLANLVAIIALILVLAKINAFPIKLPYGMATLNTWVATLLIVLPVVALGINCVTMRNTKRTMIYLFCILLSCLAILPFWIMLVNGTRSSQAIQQGVSLIPGANMMKNWSILTSKNFDISIGFRNSAIIAFSSTILSVYFSALTAYGFTVYDFKGKKFLYAVVMAIIMIPGQVTGTGFFMFMYKLGLTNNFLPLIVPGIAAASTVFFFRQYLAANFQVSLVEAARIDGAGEFYTYNKIVMPIMIPAMATMGIMAIIGNWNNYLTPLMLLSRNELKTLPMMVKELRGDIYRTEFGSIYLGLSLTSLPLIIVYFALSKYIIAGVALGGVKE